MNLRFDVISVFPLRLVLRQIIAGKLNKQIAADLGASEQTIEVHQMRITAEMVRTSE